MKKVINPQYQHLESRLVEVANGNYTPEFVYCNRRNVVERVSIDGELFVVKSYKKPPLINMIAYRFFRKSKARRAYEYALQLLDCGFETPLPVAYFEKFDKGLFKQGVFIAKYEPHKLLESIFDGSVSADERKVILSDFIDYLLSMHKKGVMPMDLNAGNVFYYKDDATGHYLFSLTDINRMKFGVKPAFKEMMFSFEQCFFPLTQMGELIDVYVQKTGIRYPKVVYYVMSHRMRRYRRNRSKSRFAALFGKK